MASSSSSSSSSSRKTCHYFSLKEISVATNNFDKRTILGTGGEGTVYLAKIKVGQKKKRVAVKHLKSNSKEFENEIKTISKIQHRNVVSLLGYCNESNQKVLVYKFMKNGSLSSYVTEKSTISLSWQQRLQICLGAARGLQHLHAETKQFPKGIIHRDVKPENILLDRNWVAKVSDFGMFKLSHGGQMQSTMKTDLKGTPGFYAPEYLKHRTVTRKIDVYAFGVVLFQVLCLKMPWDRGNESYDNRNDEDLGIWAQQNVDTEIKKEICDNSLKKFTKVVGKSLKKNPKDRPTMDEVVIDLEYAVKYQELKDVSIQLRDVRLSDQDFAETEAVLQKLFKAIKSDYHSSGSGINDEKEKGERKRRLSNDNLPANHVFEEALHRAHTAYHFSENTRHRAHQENYQLPEEAGRLRAYEQYQRSEEASWLRAYQQYQRSEEASRLRAYQQYLRQHSEETSRLRAQQQTENYEGSRRRAQQNGRSELIQALILPELIISFPGVTNSNYYPNYDSNFYPNYDTNYFPNNYNNYYQC